MNPNGTQLSTPSNSARFGSAAVLWRFCLGEAGSKAAEDLEDCRAVDGQQGVAMAAADPPALILMDMSLPVLDGWEATRRLKTGEHTKQIPIIALTAHAMQGDEQKAKEAGCDDYDVKPVELPRLLEKIERLLDRKEVQP